MTDSFVVHFEDTTKVAVFERAPCFAPLEVFDKKTRFLKSDIGGKKVISLTYVVHAPTDKEHHNKVTDYVKILSSVPQFKSIINWVMCDRGTVTINVDLKNNPIDAVLYCLGSFRLIQEWDKQWKAIELCMEQYTVWKRMPALCVVLMEHVSINKGEFTFSNYKGPGHYQTNYYATDVNLYAWSHNEGVFGVQPSYYERRTYDYGWGRAALGQEQVQPNTKTFILEMIKLNETAVAGKGVVLLALAAEHFHKKGSLDDFEVGLLCHHNPKPNDQ